jgi:heme exporter protein A
MDPSGPAPAISARGLVKQFGPATALAGIDLDVAPGEGLAVFGPNGAGKTTLLRLLTLTLRPTRGTLRILGRDPRRQGAEIRADLGVISHHLFLYDALSALENLEFFAGLYGVPAPRRRCLELLDAVGLTLRADDPIGSLSRGLQQRVAVARALVHDPAIVLLDEPFTALDPRASGVLAGLLADLRGRGRTVILTTHDLRRGLACSERFLLMARGRIVEAGPSAAADPAQLEAALAS